MEDQTFELPLFVYGIFILILIVFFLIKLSSYKKNKMIGKNKGNLEQLKKYNLDFQIELQKILNQNKGNLESLKKYNNTFKEELNNVQDL